MLKEALETTYLHFNRAKDNFDEILTFKLDDGIFENKEKIKTIDAFIFRFIKLQDFMGEKLFKELLRRIGEYKDNMSMIDILDRLEKLEIIENSDDWLDSRIIRNQLTHQYPNNTKDIVNGLKLSLKIFKKLEKYLISINNYIKEKKII